MLLGEKSIPSIAEIQNIFCIEGNKYRLLRGALLDPEIELKSNWQVQYYQVF
jgi:hypothetical protein